MVPVVAMLAGVDVYGAPARRARDPLRTARGSRGWSWPPRSLRPSGYPEGRSPRRPSPSCSTSRWLSACSWWRSAPARAVVVAPAA